MKILITALAILISFTIKAQAVHKEVCGRYIVEYTYNPATKNKVLNESAPAPLRMEKIQPQDHYVATIQVYDRDGIKVGSSFTGVYVPGGCIDDRPQNHVKRAEVSAKRRKL